MNTSVQKRIAARLLGCGVHKVWMDAQKAEDISMAITRDDIRKLIARGIIKKTQEKGISRVRVRAVNKQKASGGRRGHGTAKGKATARNPPKRSWMKRIRLQRKRLSELRDLKSLTKRSYRKLYLMAKGGAFRSLTQLNTYLEEQKLLKVK